MIFVCSFRFVKQRFYGLRSLFVCLFAPLSSTNNDSKILDILCHLCFFRSFLRFEKQRFKDLRSLLDCSFSSIIKDSKRLIRSLFVCSFRLIKSGCLLVCSLPFDSLGSRMFVCLILCSLCLGLKYHVTYSLCLGENTKLLTPYVWG